MPPDPIFHPHTITAEEKALLDRDGQLMLPGLLTPQACEKLTDALTCVQTLFDENEYQPQPNMYAAEYNDYLASLIAHPQILAMARSILGEDIRFDHCVTLNRRGGAAANTWHSHEYGEDNPDLGFIRIFFYVNGFTADDAGLKVVPGSHLYLDKSIRAQSDEELLSCWMAGKKHPATGRPLEIIPLNAPAGTVIVMWTHAAHGVTPRKPDSDTRWAVVYAYRNPGRPSEARWITEAFESKAPPETEGLMSLY